MATAQKPRARWGKPKIGARRGRKSVQQFLDGMARALTAGDGAAVARMWALPALVLGDDMSQAVSEQRELEQFFGGAKAQYNEMGIADTRPEIMRMEWLTEKLGIVDVRWPYLDAAGNEKGDEASSYVLRREADGTLKIQAAIMRGTGSAPDAASPADGSMPAPGE